MSIEIRAYNVLFGDCLLVSWDEDDGRHHAWIDFGNFHNDKNEVFDLAYDDILKRTRNGNGKNVLDLVVVTHRHLDHLEGFHTLRKRFKKDYVVKKLWYSYVARSVDSQFKIVERELQRLMPLGTREGDGSVGRVYQNNFGRAATSTKQRMKEILDEFPCERKNRHAVHRLSKISTIMPPGLRRLKIEVLAPEHDSKVYLKPLKQALQGRGALEKYFKAPLRGEGRGIKSPGGMPATQSELIHLADFARLRRLLQTGGMELLAAVDKTRNNTSVVLALTYKSGNRKRRLLLAGDAEEKSWQVMEDKGMNLEADLVKVAHHGSVNASPEGVFQKVFPRSRASNAVIISTDKTRYPSEKYENEVPKAEVVDGWRMRIPTRQRGSRFRRTDSTRNGGSVRIRFD